MEYNGLVKSAVVLALAALAGCNFRIDPLGVAAGGSDGGSVGDGAVPFNIVDLGGVGGVGADLLPTGPFLALSSVLSPAAVDLTAEGTSDWTHWGYATASDFDHKKSAGLISNFQQVGINAPAWYGDNKVIYRWSDGQPGTPRHPSTGPNGTTTGVYIFTGGLAFTAPAEPTPHRLRVYVGQLGATGRLDVSLGDNSAPAVSDRSHTAAPGGGPVNVEYVIDYAAASPGQQLDVTWSVDSAQGGNVTLQSATLQ